MSDEKAYSVEQRLAAWIGGGYDPVAGPPTLETWHSLGSPGITNFNSVHGRYRLTADGYLFVDIQGAATGATTNQTGTYANTMPAPYRPAITRTFPVIAPDVGTYYRVTVNTDGTVGLHIGVLASGNQVGGTALIPLD